MERIKELIEKTVNDLGYVLDQVTLVKESGNLFLRVSIDKSGSVDIEDCIKVSQAINPILDKEDPIEEAYVLDVCSKEKGE
jgi:ribosome maturation factor RimP